jgi:hypothetical protein
MNRIHYEICRGVAIALDQIRLNHTVVSRSNGRTTIVKTRRWFSSLLLPLGNWLLRYDRCLSEVLNEREWLDWERRVWAVVEEIPTPGSLAEYGPNLADTLSSTEHSIEQKMQAIGLALVSLSRLQQRTIEWPDGRQRPLSHGDATCKNVCVDLPNQTATWIDFDIRHHPTVAPLNRFSDDFRALVFSSACHIDDAHYPELSRLLWETMTPELSDSFQDSLNHAWTHTTLFHLAQAPLSYLQLQQLNAALRSTFPAES